MMHETIYSLVPVAPEKVEKPSMYRSMHPPDSQLAGTTIGLQGTTRPLGVGSFTSRKAHATFGRSEASYRSDPKQYLKKGARSTNIWSDSAKRTIGGGTISCRDTTKLKASVPRRDDVPVFGVASTKNFITTNAVAAILAKPGGNARSRAPVINYLEKEDYGQVPGYLEQVKAEVKHENDMIDTFVREQIGMCEGAPQMVTPMDEFEREDLVDKLKAKWDDANKDYQLLAHVVNLDCYGMFKRKERLEAELKQLERDIEKLEVPGGGPIYITEFQDGH
ncbi:unnamed protein product [Chrysoparadoxa australica]